jgi:acetylxylan esterase
LIDDKESGSTQFAMRGIISLATSLVISLFALRLSHAQTVSTEQCATSVHAVLARGQGAGDDLDVMVTIQDLILQQIPGSTSQALPYGHGGSDIFLAVHDGALLLQQYVRDYVASCGPEAKIALVGYSMVRTD